VAEKRKPTYIILLRKSGKKSNKLEIYKAILWGTGRRIGCGDGYSPSRYRARTNGKWFKNGKRKFFTMTEIMGMLANVITNRRRRAPREEIEIETGTLDESY
jgi:hypothetical protein